MTVPRPKRPKDYLRGEYGNDKSLFYEDAIKWNQERIEQLLKYPKKSDDLYRALGIVLHRYIQYQADSKGLKGDKLYPE